MISVRLERVIFSIIFLICFIITGRLAVQAKAKLPLNKELNVEEVIELTFPQIDSNYEYKIKDNYMFLYGKKTQGTFSDIAFRNDNSGFIFEFPGLVVGDIYETKNKIVTLPDGNMINVSIRKYYDDYTISIVDVAKIDNIVFYNHGSKLDYLTFEGSESKVWIEVITNSNRSIEIYGIYDNKKVLIINAKELNKLFGGE